MSNEDVSIIRTRAGARLAPELFTLRLTGPDRVRYLDGMVSNHVAKLQPGQAQRAVKANPKGKVEGVLRVRATEDTLYLDVLEAVASRVAGALVKLLIMDDATLTDATPDRDAVQVLGPAAPAALQEVGLEVGDLGALEQRAYGDRVVVRDDRLGVPGFDVFVPAGQGQGLLQSLEGAGVKAVSAEAVDVLRVEAGVPVDGVDLDDDTIPLEANLDEALDFTKGCYVGQETIARAHNLGGVKHRLVGLEIDGAELPPAGAVLRAEGADKDAGELTSIVRSPTLDRVIALGYVRVAHEAPGTPLSVTWDGGEARATVRALPFVPAA